MYLKHFYTPILLCLTIIISIGCQKKTEELDTELVSDYLPLQVGKHITYRLDSIVFVDVQSRIDTHQYIVRHIVSAETVDNAGRKSFSISRLIKPASSTDSIWQPNGIYLITPLRNTIEVNEENLRTIKLAAPIKADFEWKGNTYLPQKPYVAFGYDFSVDGLISEWKYKYNLEPNSFSYQNNNYQQIITVNQIDESINLPLTNRTETASKAYIEEKYSKDIGLVYRHFELWDYQKNPNPHYTGFGVRMWMISHN